MKHFLNYFSFSQKHSEKVPRDTQTSKSTLINKEILRYFCQCSEDLIRQHADFILYDLQGRQVFTKQLQALENQMDISGLPSGIYLYRIAGTGKIYQTGKVVKQ